MSAFVVLLVELLKRIPFFEKLFDPKSDLEKELEAKRMVDEKLEHDMKTGKPGGFWKDPPK